MESLKIDELLHLEERELHENLEFLIFLLDQICYNFLIMSLVFFPDTLITAKPDIPGPDDKA